MADVEPRNLVVVESIRNVFPHQIDRIYQGGPPPLESKNSIVPAAPGDSPCDLGARSRNQRANIEASSGGFLSGAGSHIVEIIVRLSIFSPLFIADVYSLFSAPTADFVCVDI